MEPAPTTSLSQQFPDLWGQVNSDIQSNSPGGFWFNGGTQFPGKFFVPGTPNMRVNGGANFGGVLDGSGSTSPQRI